MNIIVTLVKTMINDFKGWKKTEYIWLITSTISVIFLSWYLGDNSLGIVSAIMNILCVVLVTYGKITNYFFGIIGVLLYAYVSYINKIYGDFTLNILYYFPMQFYGIYMWKNSITEKNINIRSMKLKNKIIVITISIISIYFYGKILKRMGGQVPFLDSASTILSIVSQYLMAKAYKEQWNGWIIVNIISVIMWYKADTSQISALLMWIVFLINSILGFYKWRKKGVN